MTKDFVAWLIRLICGVRRIPAELCPPGSVVYFANHSSHLDFTTIWAALPKAGRDRVRPVAGRDYWEKSPLRRRVACDFFNSVLSKRDYSSCCSRSWAFAADSSCRPSNVIAA
jgi:hypothetical protein